MPLTGGYSIDQCVLGVVHYHNICRAQPGGADQGLGLSRCCVHCSLGLFTFGFAMPEKPYLSTAMHYPLAFDLDEISVAEDVGCHRECIAVVAAHRGGGALTASRRAAAPPAQERQPRHAVPSQQLP